MAINSSENVTSNSHAHPDGNLPARLLPIREQLAEVLPKQEQLSIDAASALHSQLVDRALAAAGISNDDVAFALDVSASLVRKMRSAQNREQMSNAQMLVVGFTWPRFYIEYNSALNDRTSWFDLAAARWQRMSASFFAIGAR